MTGQQTTGSSDEPTAELRQVPVAWEALEDAFENNAPEVHSYLHMGTGDVLRVVDGVADPGTHARIAVDASYLRVDPVSSREQYRWMERFIVTVEEGPFRQKLQQAIDGKGAFRRFKDVLMSFPVDRERWFQFRSERLRTCMEGWLEAQGVVAVARPEWEVPSAGEVKPQVDANEKNARRAARGNSAGALRRHLHEVADLLPVRELDTAVAFLEFLRDRRHVPRGVQQGGVPESSDEDGSRAS